MERAILTAQTLIEELQDAAKAVADDYPNERAAATNKLIAKAFNRLADRLTERQRAAVSSQSKSGRGAR